MESLALFLFYTCSQFLSTLHFPNLTNFFVVNFTTMTHTHTSTGTSTPGSQEVPDYHAFFEKHGIKVKDSELAEEADRMYEDEFSLVCN